MKLEVLHDQSTDSPCWGGQKLVVMIHSQVSTHRTCTSHSKLNSVMVFPHSLESICALYQR